MSRETRTAARLLWALAGGALACGGGQAEATTEAPPADETSDTDIPMFEKPAPADACEEAPTVDVGRWEGSFASFAGAFGGACGMGGPDAFLRLTIPTRADLRVYAEGEGFVPRVAVTTDACEPGAELACTTDYPPGEPLVIPDLRGGTAIRVVIGVDPDDPILVEPAEGEALDLEFFVDLGLTKVLDEGDRCEPAALGRCVFGTACLPGGDDEPARCQAIAADTCAAPEDVAVPTSGATLQLAADEPQNDAHHLSCTGAGARDRVYRLALPAGLGDGAVLRIHTDHPGVGLGLRAPSCLDADERACAAPAEDGATVDLGDLAALAGDGVAPLLFVELPQEPDAGEVAIELTILDG
ncbi:MAG: hypothetical protein R3A51_06135 [Nannocystaceae bacterium]|nr:hypothetical protein [Myxococcales bacterium]